MVARLIRYYCLAEKLQRSKAIRKKLKFIGEELLIVVAKIHNIFFLLQLLTSSFCNNFPMVFPNFSRDLESI